MALRGRPRELYPLFMEGIRLLIIDEHVDAGNILARRLSSISGFQVVGTTADAEEGLRQIGNLVPDLVLLDIKMTDADGLDVCRRACSQFGIHKVAVLTSYGDTSDIRKAQEAGAKGYFLKEVNTQRLAHEIRGLAGRG